jgi:hypothetical protein
MRLHLAGCDGCRSWVAAFNSDRESIRQLADEMPPGVNWDRMAAEMSANVRVGLEAGECVASRVRKPTVAIGWRVAAATAGVAILLVSAWWLNMPRADSIAPGLGVGVVGRSKTANRRLKFPRPEFSCSRMAARWACRRDESGR